jgi:hypothetical protein
VELRKAGTSPDSGGLIPLPDFQLSTFNFPAGQFPDQKSKPNRNLSRV